MDDCPKAKRAKSAAPEIATTALFKRSDELPVAERVEVRGADFNTKVDLDALMSSLMTTGFQATQLARAINEVNKMLDCRERPLPDDKLDTLEEDPFIRRKTSCTIFFGYTSNMGSAGVRDIIRFLAQHKLVDCLVTTAGGVEEDLIKCMAPTYLGEFSLKGQELRNKGINRIGNLLAPNDNYCKFEDWIMPVLDEMLEEQKNTGITWSPSRMIARFGERIAHTDSIYYWAQKNQIPVFCPAITDGSIGDMLYFHSFRSPGLVVDLVQDIRRINSMAVKAEHSGMLILGGGVVKHHICNANLMRNGADFAVYINTGQEFDGSDSGASPDEAVSWGKIKAAAQPVKVCVDASIAFPLLVSQTFAKRVNSAPANECV
ncbi:probable deoxyhypusine synthase isoform X1 [Varroa jacobsoni]|uniref:deoxyhypusine synthase n=2 Tax=Varroa destructor TaxID=109461 RepID=A0A7M7JNG1_VARDE|nr:deoxyhypusine synthase-like isoform X1 [Varroa destructor]XP_022688429.1 probable deoxyhypusine synthase isoform X1 [Varroa jacobsoni]